MHIWKKLRIEICEGKDLRTGAVVRTPRPLIVLAPMADVTDISFRTLIAEKGNPDMMWTEFVSADGLVRATPEGKAKLMKDLLYTSREHPIVAQVFGSRPQYMEEAAYLVASLGYDGIDINMGCPDSSIEKQGAGSGMIKTPLVAQSIVRAAQAGALRAFTEGKGVRYVDRDGTEQERDEPIPVSVKTRIGYSKNELETWLPALLEVSPAVVTIHARTRKELSLVPARWEHVKEAVEIRDRVQAHLPLQDRTLILGNGDVQSVADGLKKSIAATADGAMLGRALFGNPWLFSPLSHASTASDTHAPSPAHAASPAQTVSDTQTTSPNGYTDEQIDSVFASYTPTVLEKLETAVVHTELFVQHLGDTKSFALTKKHFKAYINGFDGAKELRAELMEHASTAQDVRDIIERFKASRPELLSQLT
jgi:tRNA-dihydrouridine synthase B